MPQDFTITGIVGDPDYWSNDYGEFVTYDLTVAETEGVVQLNRKESSPEPEVGETIYGHLEHPNPEYPPKLKTDRDDRDGKGKKSRPSSGGKRPSGGGKGGGYTPEDLAAIRRNEAQGKAVQWLIFKALAKQTPTGSGKDGQFVLTVDFFGTDGLVDQFARDVQQASEAVAKKGQPPASTETPPTPTETDSPPPKDDEDIPF